jgi:predicted nucleic acid-binding Zn ribbon protein
MATCPFCRAEIADDAVTCPSCGAAKAYYHTRRRNFDKQDTMLYGIVVPVVFVAVALLRGWMGLYALLFLIPAVVSAFALQRGPRWYPRV